MKRTSSGKRDNRADKSGRVDRRPARLAIRILRGAICPCRGRDLSAVLLAVAAEGCGGWLFRLPCSGGSGGRVGGGLRHLRALRRRSGRAFWCSGRRGLCRRVRLCRRLGFLLRCRSRDLIGLQVDGQRFRPGLRVSRFRCLHHRASPGGYSAGDPMRPLACRSQCPSTPSLAYRERAGRSGSPTNPRNGIRARTV